MSKGNQRSSKKSRPNSRSATAVREKNSKGAATQGSQHRHAKASQDKDRSKSGRSSFASGHRSKSSGNRSPTRDSQPIKTIPQGLIEGRVDVHADGFGFLIPKDPSIPNIYVLEESLRDVMHRDEVLVQVDSSFEGGNKVRGRVHSITKRAQKEFLGLLRNFGGGALAIPTEARNRHLAFKVNDSRIDLKAQASGTVVLCKILDYPTKSSGTCEVVKVVKDVEKASMDTIRVIVEAGWPREFSAEAIADAEVASKDWIPKLRGARQDLQHMPFVTIDGRDARDFDDAVCGVMEKGQLKLWVAIADVSHFVRPGTKLDIEAFERSTSVYMPDHVVPMLPEVLSNGVCSLNPNETRATMVCEMVLNAQGKVDSYKIYQGLIESKKRLTYDLMQAYMEKEPYAVEELSHLSPSLDAVMEAYRRLRQAKTLRGAIDLDIPEAFVMLDPQGEVTDIQTRTRLESHRLIEECMLIANECTASFLKEHFSQAVYRVHEVPDERKITDLITFLTQTALIDTNQLKSMSFTHPKDFSRLLDVLKTNFDPQAPQVRVANTLTLRSLKQARYASEPLGHFALALADYTHFTSPIRRYPDLIVHRLLKEALKIEASGHQESQLASQTQHSSDRERQAVDIERKVIDIKKCRFMEPKLGEEFDASVTGMTEKGIFCQIDNHFVDGFISGETLYSRAQLMFNPDHMNYVSRTKKSLGMGDRVRVQLAAVDIFTQRINFEYLGKLDELDPPTSPESSD